jgi:hypothetical protein
VFQKREQDKDRFELLVAKFISVGKKAKAARPSGAPLASGELSGLRAEATSILDELVHCCEEMDDDDDWRRFLAIALIAASVEGSDLLGFELLELLDKILPN